MVNIFYIMHIRFKLIFILSSIMLVSASRPSIPEGYTQISNNSGLSNSSVTTIFQDSSGEMWFGTWNGLNRYDGTGIRQYRPQGATAGSISHQVIRSIAEDTDGYLWIATDFGINRMDRQNETFSVYYIGYGRPYIHEEGLFSCCVSDKGEVAAALKGQSVQIYDKSSDRFQPLPGLDTIDVASVLFYDRSERLWIETDEGDLCRITVHDGAAVNTETIHLAADHGTPIFDGSDRIWVQTGDNITYIDIYSDSVGTGKIGTRLKSTLNTIREIDGKLYAGTTTGCFIIDGDGHATSITGKNIPVLSIYKGTQDIIWIGTDGLGVLKERYKSEFITTIRPSSASGRFPVRAIHADSTGFILIGSKGGGLTVLDSTGKVYRKFNVGSGRTYNSVLSIERAGDRIYIGTDGTGLQYMTSPSGPIYSLDLSGFPGNSMISSVYSIEKAGRDTLFLGTSGNGLFRIVTGDSGNIMSITNYRHLDQTEGTIGSNIIYDIVNDGRFLWLATRGSGINKFDKITGQAEIIRGDKGGPAISNDILSLMIDSSGRLWAGTSSGLAMISEPYSMTPQTRVFNEFPEVSNTSIHSILEGTDKSVWVSTDNGIARLSAGADTVTSWTYEDGLSDNEYCDGAGFAADNGTQLFFGSIGGVDVITPVQADLENFMPELNLSLVEVDNSRYYPEGNIISTDYRSGSISFRFSLPDYVSGEKCSVAYFLKRGKEIRTDNIQASDWIDIGNSRMIIISQLRPGNYTLLVRPVDPGHNFGEPKTWIIEVSWPKLLKPWLILLYSFIFLGIICILYWLHKSRKSISEELEREKRDNAVKEEIMKGKFRFFTNIAHEFSNSITLIFGAVEQILARGTLNDRDRRQLIAIRSNADRMHRQIEELMEFSKADSGHLSVIYEKVDISELFKYTSDNFIDVAESKKIKMDISVDSALPSWVTDRSMLEKIVFNLLSNAMKYTPADGWIKVHAERNKSGDLEIRVVNSGPGIPQDRLSDIFDRYVILDNFESKLSHGHYSRTGIGLALCEDLTLILRGKISVDSKINEYTVFTVTIPWKDDNEITVASMAEGQKEKIQEIPAKTAEQRAAILVVDDFEDIRTLISDILSEEFDVIQASSGETALRILEDASPALVICDMIMPGMGGIDFVKKMKSDEHTRSIPIIMLSCDTDIENRVNIINTGADVFIAKPFQPRYLKAVVEKIFKTTSAENDTYDPLGKVLGNVDIHSPVQEDSSFVNKVMDALSRNYSDENYNQDALAYDMAMSRVQLYRKVKHALGSTPGELIRRYRIRQAEIMLLKTEKTVQEIMYDCGFHNKAYFYREFSRLHNCSPKDFRNRH